MEDAGTSEEDDDINSQDSNTPIDHSHLTWNCSIKIITPVVKASVISMFDSVSKGSVGKKGRQESLYFDTGAS